MKATVCQLPAPGGVGSEDGALEESWSALGSHVRRSGSDFVLLPEMPFHSWLPARPEADPAAWAAAAGAHDRWIRRFDELGARIVAGSRPVVEEDRRFNEGFVWTAEAGLRSVQRKRHLPDEPGFWEATWYDPGPEGPFRTVELEGGLRLGFLVCTDLWFGRHARELGEDGAHLILCPRATPLETREKWLVGGRAAAISSGAWCLSSNVSGPIPGGDASAPPAFAGAGWIVEPEAGRIVGVTDGDVPFLTVELSLESADAAKDTYPRYVD